MISFTAFPAINYKDVITFNNMERIEESFDSATFSNHVFYNYYQ